MSRFGGVPMKTRSYDEVIGERRRMLKSLGDEHNTWESHQRKGISPPPLEKLCPKDGILVELIR